MKFQAALSLIATMCGFASAAWALPLSVTESGDFADGSPLSAVGTLDIGINTISGDTSDGASGPRAGDTDFFSVELPAGLAISSIELSVSNFLNGSTGGLSNADLTTPHGGSTGPFDSNGLFPFVDLAISDSSSTIGFRILPGASTGGIDTFDYSVSITVVPEAAKVYLLLLGLTIVSARVARSPRGRCPTRRCS
jgi:hypothetical protein